MVEDDVTVKAMTAEHVADLLLLAWSELVIAVLVAVVGTLAAEKADYHSPLSS